ncbi:TetR/AcrR family transcriptional regulator [Actinomadura atramentaria]|uniref:TetR/AcrR family transcriptional regulator n=1 Tax=Actinomadura atramentaria TaxID=1990 RepID=UPI00037650E7|nr:TetR/AcrR family transcriptional regulator [Actinomadura atramentaria]
MTEPRHEPSGLAERPARVSTAVRQAPTRSPDEIRARILDAAAECLVEGGFASGRLLSVIARRAGISRPTLYKYGGSVDDIKEALVERELGVFVDALAGRLRNLTWTAESLTDLLVFIVGYARGHPLLKAALRDVPELALPVFTLYAEDPIRRISTLVAPAVQEAVDRGQIPSLDVPLLTDALFRVTMALVLVRSPLDLDDSEMLRAYVTASLAFVHELPPVQIA